jgi:di/tricarboxylate transporter
MQIAIVFITVSVAVVLFLTEALSIDVVAVLMLLALSLTGVLTPVEALSGFSDQAVITIAGFFIVSAAFFNTGVVEAIGRRLHRISGSSGPRLVATTMLAAAAIAAFMSNVVTTAVLMPAVIGIARRIRQPVSRFLMPLAFGAVLGGKVTLIGSSTNLAVNGLLPRYGMAPFSMFEFSPLGLALVVAGILFMMLVGTRLLPDREDDDSPYGAGHKEYVSEVQVLPASPLAGKTLAEADFRGTYGIQVLGIVRRGEQQLPHRDSRLSHNDLLLVKGNVEQLLRLQDGQGLKIVSDHAEYHAEDVKDTVIVQAILSPNSAFAGRTLKQIRFGVRYGVNVLGIYRHHQAIYEKLSDIRLQFGDVLIIQGSSGRIDNLRLDADFLTLDDVEHTPFRKNRAVLAVAIFAVAVIIAGLKLAPIALVAMAAAVAMLLARCITIHEAYDRIEWTALVLIAATIPLGIAMEKTGAARVLAEYVTGYIGGSSPLIMMGGFFLFTVVLTQPMANAACALILTPIAINVANQLQVNPRAFAITIAIAASCTFPTPLEPVTAIVYGPGKYRFLDYVRVGVPMTLLVLIVTLLVVPIFWPL